MEQPLEHLVYSKKVLEFVTVANEYCHFLESSVEYTRRDFVTVAARLLPLVYLKASVLPRVEAELEEPVEKTVNEMMYAGIQNAVEGKLGRYNDYLEVFTPDFKYSETPVITYVAEDLADIYQDLKDFLSAYKIGVTEIMNDALSAVQQNFEMYWGQRCVNGLRALHALLYGEDDLEEEDGEDEFREEQEKDNWFTRMQRDWQDDNDELGLME